MDGVLVIHASSGHVLFSKAYTTNFGLALRDERAKHDPMVASMLLANFLCALYTNVLNLVDAEAALPADDATTTQSSTDAKPPAAAAEAAAAERDRRLQDLMRDPLRSFDTGANGPLLFFRRHEASNIILALFLRRSLLDGQGSGSAPAPDATSDLTDWSGDSKACLVGMEGVGEWLAAALLRSFVTAHADVLLARPFRGAGGGSNQAFRSWIHPLEELYTGAFSRQMVARALGQMSAEWEPAWAYAVYADKFIRGMEEEQTEKHAREEEARQVKRNEAEQRQQQQQQRPSRPQRRRASGSVGDASAIVVAQPPALVPHPPSGPSPAALAAAAAHAVPSASAGTPVPPVAAHSAAAVPSFASTASRPLPANTPPVPFHPPPSRRRWWPFSRGGGSDKGESEMFLQRLGHTTCFYDLGLVSSASGEEVSFSRAAATGAGAGSKADVGPRGSRSVVESFLAQDEGAQIAARSEVEDAMRGVLGANCAPPTVAVAPVPPPVTPLPTPAALRRLAALVHNAGMVLSSHSSVDDRLSSLEITVSLPHAHQAAGGSPASLAALSTRVWVFRVHDLLLCFPTAPLVVKAAPSLPDDGHAQGAVASAAAAPTVRHCTLQELRASLQPMLRCLDVHYAFVADLHARAERTLKKSMEKMQRQKAAAAST